MQWVFRVKRVYIKLYIYTVKSVCDLIPSNVLDVYLSCFGYDSVMSTFLHTDALYGKQCSLYQQNKCR
jgi:hypothetical protein